MVVSLDMAHENIRQAQKNKKDEFYTSYDDVQNEVSHYRDAFSGKTVLCNCDDVYRSNFVKYFLINFNDLHLKRLIVTGFSVGDDTNAYALDVPSVGVSLSLQTVNDFIAKQCEVFISRLSGNFSEKKFYPAGDFRSSACIDYLKQADIICTNPPFSKFKEFLSLLNQYQKQFLIIGNQNAITYKDVFPLIKSNKLWLGYGFRGNVGFFDSPYLDTATSNQHCDGKIRVSGVVWFTNIDHKSRCSSSLNLKQSYYDNPKKYPKYHNYDAIHISKTSEIPYDYDGIMSVPITFLNSFSPNQFEILGLSSKENCGSVPRLHSNDFYNGYRRGKVSTRIESNLPLLDTPEFGGTLCKKDGNPDLYQMYWRIFIKRK